MERGYIPNAPRVLLNSKLGKLDIHPASSSFSHMQAMARAHAEDCIEQAFQYEKNRWDKTHKESDIEVGDQVLLSTINFNNLNTNIKLKDPFVGPFIVLKNVGPNTLELDLYGPYTRKHPVFPISLVKKYYSSGEIIFPSRKIISNNPMLDLEEAVIDKVLNHRLVKDGSKKIQKYLIRYKDRSSDFDRWLPASEIQNAGSLLRQKRMDKKMDKK